MGLLRDTVVGGHPRRPFLSFKKCPASIFMSKNDSDFYKQLRDFVAGAKRRRIIKKIGIILTIIFFISLIFDFGLKLFGYHGMYPYPNIEDETFLRPPY